MVEEVNLALFPVLVVTLAGDVPERTLLALARDLEDRIEGLPDVLEVEIGGDREELLEIVIDPLRIESLRPAARGRCWRLVDRNNRLVAAGALDTGQGRFAVKVPGVFETADDMLGPADQGRGRPGRHAAATSPTVRRTFKDPEGFARVDGRPALALEVKKRIGAQHHRDRRAGARAWSRPSARRWPADVEVGYLQDKSDDIRNMLHDLENNVLCAVVAGHDHDRRDAGPALVAAGRAWPCRARSWPASWCSA